MPRISVDILHADPVDVLEHQDVVDLDTWVDDYLWLRRNEMLAMNGHRYFI